MMDNHDAIRKKEEENYEFLGKCIQYCKRFDPMFSQEAKQMVVKYYAGIMTLHDSQASPRLFETLYNLCRALARLKQKDTIDPEDVKEIAQFYNVQLVHHLSQVVAIPSDPHDLSVEVIVNILRSSKFKYEFIELLKTACERDEWVSGYIGFNKEGKRDWSVETNKKVRYIRDRFTKGPNPFRDQILTLSISPLVLAWRNTYEGDDNDAVTDSNDGSSSQESECSKGRQHDIVSVNDLTDLTDQRDGRTAINDAGTDKIVGTNSNPVNKEPGGSVGSIRSVRSVESEPQDKDSDIKAPSGEKEEPIEDYEVYIARQKAIFGAIAKDIPAHTATPPITTSIPSSSQMLDPNGKPVLAPYISRMYPGSDLLKCEYCSIIQDRWGMATHFHPEGSRKRKR
jgi:hypothetical protein